MKTLKPRSFLNFASMKKGRSHPVKNISENYQVRLNILELGANEVL